LDEASGYLKRALDLDENDVQAILAFAEVLSDLGKPTEALTALNRIPLHDFKPEVLETTFGIHLKAGNGDEAEKVASQLLDLDGQYFKLFLTLANWELAQDNLDRAALSAGKVAELAIKHNAGNLVESQLKSILQKRPDHIPTLLALVKFYSLSNGRQYLAPLLEKIGAIYIRSDQLAEAASVYYQLVQLEPNDPVHRENLRQVQERSGLSADETSLPKLVPDMGALADKFLSEPTLQTITPQKIEQDKPEGRFATEDEVKGFIVEGDLFAGYGLHQKAIDQYQRVIEAIPHHIEAHEKIRDICAKSGDLSKAASECLILANIFTARGDSENANRNFTLAYQYDPSLHQAPIEAEGVPVADSGTDLAEQGESPGSKAAATVPKKFEDLLQEADFYLDLGFLSEAKASMDQYRLTGPANAEFQQRLDRYESLLKAQGGGAQEPDAQKPETEVATDTSVAAASEEIDLSGFESTSHSLSEEPAGTGTAEVSQAEGFESTSVAEAQPAPTQPLPTAPASESFDDMMVDLDEELVESTLEVAVKPVPTAPSKSSPARQNDSATGGALSDVFQEFKEGMEDDSESGDYETHYNLGTAFKEMGLMEEAIGEFQKALKVVGSEVASEEFVRCCNMLGLCFVDKGLPQVAVKWFTRGLTSPGRNEETYQALRYDLGCAHEMAGNEKAALETFLDVYGVNINYRDVSEKIESLKNRIHG
jgi:tetratricopeptide (TPR) repeat protein